MNSLIYNTQGKKLSLSSFVKNGGIYTPLVVDSQGRVVTSPNSHMDVTTSNFDIRPLDENTDSAVMTVSNLDIRDIDGIRDFLGFSKNSSVVASESGTILLLQSRNFLPRDVSPYKKTLS